MKVRHGFVSNSSSSSFIVAAYDARTLQKVRVVVEIDLTSFQFSGIATNEEELLRYFADYFDYYPGEDLDYDRIYKSRFDSALEAIHNGQVVAIGEVSSDSHNPLEVLLYNEGFGMLLSKIPNIKLIYKE